MGQTLSCEQLLEAATVSLRIPVENGTGQATGFFIAPRIVATCAHVFKGLEDQEIAGAVDGQHFKLRASDIECFQNHEGLDVALLRLAEAPQPEQDEAPQPGQDEAPGPGHDEAPGPDRDYVLVSNELALGDWLWTFGFPVGTYAGGQPADFKCLGFSKLHQGAALQLARVAGVWVGPGYSGSPVLNRRTGAVCGMLCTSDKEGRGSAHLLPIAEILAVSDELRKTHAEPESRQRAWLDRLDDARVQAGGWRYPGPAIRDYLTTALQAAEQHPYPGVDPGKVPPTLSEVYVHQEARAGPGAEDLPREAQMLPARTVFEPPGSSVLVGTAGSGKSSLFRIAVTTEVREWQGGKPIRWVPVRVQAADLVAARTVPAAIAASVCDDLCTFGLKQSWPAETFARPPFPDAEWLVLVDGLDELISADQRQDVLTKLAGLNARDERIFRFVVATRPPAEDNSAIPLGWAPRRFELLPFTDGQFSKVAANWFELELPEVADAVEQFLIQVRERELAEIARNPLMAAILCQLFASAPGSSLPPGRSRIFDAFEELLSNRMYSRSRGGIRYQLEAALERFGKIAVDAGETLLARAPDLIRYLAWRRISGDTTATMDLVSNRLAGLKPRHVSATAWQGVLRDLLRRSGVLQERAGDFVFFHRTIAEHLAAQHVAADPGLSDDEFSRVFNQPLWQEVQSYARFLVATWAGRPDLPGTLNRVLEESGLAGARFVTSLQTDGLELPRELYDGSLVRLLDFAVDPDLPEPDRRAAAETVLAGDKSFGIDLLVSAVRAPSLGTPYRSWALEKLAAAQHRLSPGPAPRSLESTLLHAMRSLAEQSGDNGRDLINFVATDSSWPRQGREWAAQALQAAGQPASDVLEPLIKALRATHPEADIRLIERAYDVAAYWHRGQTRKSRDPYISHPLAAAKILAESGLNIETICAALLHDTVEESPYTLAELRGEFGADIAGLVDGVTKLDKIQYGESAEAETVRKMVVSMSSDVRVLLIEIACRLDFMRTLGHVPRQEQEQSSRQALEIFAPLAQRLGMTTIQRELEDLAFAIMHPREYRGIARRFSELLPMPDAFLQEVIADVRADLRDTRIKGTVTGRVKHYYSIHQKMMAHGVDFDEIYDLVGVRILVDTVRDCYASLGTIHARWNPVRGQFRDFIAMPDFSMYQSLHTTVIGPGGKPVELQIRTWDMHKRAEYGPPAQWWHQWETGGRAAREGKASSATKAKDEASEMAWLRQLVDWQRETKDPEEFLDSMRFEMGGAEIYVFTPRGEVIALPPGSTPVDFGYAVHTEVGHRTIGARINGCQVALDSPLDNGDTVELVTSKAQEAGPNRDWLNFVKSARARNKIRQWFSMERRDADVEAGKDQIAKAMRKQSPPLQRLMTADTLRKLARELRYADLSGLYAAVGEGRISALSVVTQMVNLASGTDAYADHAEPATLAMGARAPRPETFGDSAVEVEGMADVLVQLSKCCTPVPDDEIQGFVTHGHGVSVHRADCVNLAHLTKTARERTVTVRWATSDAAVFLVTIAVEALDRAKLLSDVTRVLSDQRVNILSASVTTSRDRLAISKLSFEMGDPKHLGDVLRAVRGVDGVYDVYRVT